MNRPARPRERATLAAAATLMLLATSGCFFLSEASAGVEADDVVRVDWYTYDYDVEPAEVTRTSSTENFIIEEMVTAFTEVPVRRSRYDLEDLQGSAAMGVRFTLESGDTVEFTQVFRSHYDVVIFWGDGTAHDGEVHDTEWGIPLYDYYGAWTTITEEVDLDEVPEAVLP